MGNFYLMNANASFIFLTHFSVLFHTLSLRAMVIAVNTRFLLGDTLEGYGYFIKEVFTRLAASHPHYQFYFLFDRPVHPSLQFGPNVTPIVAPPPARHPLLWKYWYDVAVPRTLKKIKADVFVSPDGFLSLTTKVPQCLVVHDLGFLHYSEGYQQSHLRFYKWYTPRFLKKATSIATVSQFSKDDIVQQYGVPPDKINVVYSAAKLIFKPLPWESHAAVKGQYSEGDEYFIYTGAIHPRKNLINLLKAFSIFKKRQKSSLKLLLAGRLAWKNNEFLELLKTYKYRSDVVLLDYLPENELVRVFGAAYALVYPSFFEGFGVPVLEAMACEVPVLTSSNSSMQEIAGDAALYFDPHNVAEIAEALMQVYKDEDGRQRLIEKGKTINAQYTWQKTADALWQSIETAAKG